MLSVPEPSVDDRQILGEVLRVDRFGNLVTNVDRRTFERFSGGASIEIVAGTQAVGAVVAAYAEAQPDAVCALFGSSDHLEVAVNGGSAAERLGLGRGGRVTITRS
jgi:S-adenosylmethionine hydrolase